MKVEQSSDAKQQAPGAWDYPTLKDRTLMEETGLGHLGKLHAADRWFCIVAIGIGPGGLRQSPVGRLLMSFCRSGFFGRITLIVHGDR